MVDISDTTQATQRPNAASLLRGAYDAAGKCLGISENIKSLTALRELFGREELDVHCADAVQVVYNVIQENWNRAKEKAEQNGGLFGSSQNWRWHKPQTRLSVENKNTSQEVILERALVIEACKNASRNDWSNQIPVASGIVSPTSDRRRAIDLVFKHGEGSFEFIELKVASDTLLYAAIEIIGYTCVWLLSRQEPSVILNNESSLLSANRIRATVLAPKKYFKGFDLSPLAAGFDSGLRSLGEKAAVELSFSFDPLPEGFAVEKDISLYNASALNRILDRQGYA